ncbi:MAG: FG-GAP repeat domain-containing protein, partial [Vicinamibacteraceae bacterium]
ATGAPASASTATEAEARAVCAGACHRFPPADILPRAAWRDALARMMLIRDGLPELAGAKYDLPLPPDWLRVLRYYESHAPDALPEAEPWPPITASKVRLTRHALAPPVASDMPAIANVRFVDVDEDEAIEIIASDMRTGEVLRIDPRGKLGVKTLATLRNPAHIEMADLDEDGRRDLLVADLGSLLPADHENGTLYWLQQQRNGAFKAIAVADKLARLADAQVADFDADGDLDIVLAVFGWRLTGQIMLLENQTKDWAAPSFVQKTLDRRTGAIHVPIADLDENGRPDFVALLAQEHESVVAFLNTPTSPAFKAETI